MSQIVLPTKTVKKLEAALLEKENEKIEWIDADEARKLLGRGKELKKSTLSTYVSKGKIPTDYYKRSLNGKLWFNKKKIMGF